MVLVLIILFGLCIILYLVIQAENMGSEYIHMDYDRFIEKESIIVDDDDFTKCINCGREMDKKCICEIKEIDEISYK